MGPETNTISSLIDRRAGSDPDLPFLISPETGRRLTFSGLRQQAMTLCAHLRQLGLAPGDKVAFILDNGLFTAELFLGAMYGGFVTVPLNVRAGASQLAYTLDHSDSKVVFAGGEYQNLIKEVLVHVPRPITVVLCDPDKGPANPPASVTVEPAPPVKPEDVALLMYTSGSTGQPKGGVHTHRSLFAHGRNSVAGHKLTGADRSLLVLPLYHINAECVTLIPTLLSGGSIVVPHHFNASRFWDWMDEYRCTWSALVPTIISQLLDWKDPKAGSRAAAFERIRFLRSSSAPLSPSLHREFLDKFKLPLIQAMGCTELGNVFSNPVPPGMNKIGSPGLPWGIEAKIINRDGVEVPDGEPGEILLRGDAMMQGYYKDPVGTAAAVDTDGWLHTGDLAYRDPDGYFFVVGRSKELIIKGGMNIAPRQIDEILESHPAVLEAAAVGIPDRYVGEDVVAFAVLREGMRCDEKELLQFCEGRLGHFKTPTRIYFVQDLPKGPSGKVQRLRLVEEAAKPGLAKSGSLAVETGTPSTNGNGQTNGAHSAELPVEQIISGIWSELLTQPNIDVQSNFFALGGYSLLAIQCLSRLREKIGVNLSLSDFFENATVTQLAAMARTRLSESPAQDGAGGSASAIELPPIPLRDRSVPCPLSPAQESVWFMEQLAPEALAYNESEAVRLTGSLDVEALERGLNIIVARHEILRTTIQVTNGKSACVVHEDWRLKMKRLSLEHLPPEQRNAEVERLLIEEPRRQYYLRSEPGIRATLVKLADNEHVFILMMHHIVCDWSSEGVLWRELSASYRDLIHGKSPILPPLAIQHGDYAVWQKQVMDEGANEEDLAYWEKTLRGAPSLLELPTDRPRPAAITYRGARKRFRIGAELVKALRDCSRREKTSLFTLFTAALNCLFYRYTGSEDISLGIPMADRDRKELQSIIGFLLRVHVLRTPLSGEMTFKELVARVQKGVLDLYAHRSPPFDQIVSRVKPERNVSYSPLFQVMMNWRDRDQQLTFIGIDGLAVESLLAETRTSKFDLTLMLTDDEDEIWLEMEYSTDLFDADRIERMVGHYRTILGEAAANPDRRLLDLPLLPEAERHQILVEWNRTTVEYSRDKCLHQLVEEQARRTPEAIAMRFEGRQLTYGELNTRANQLARHLRELGVGPDVLVGVCVERSLEMVVGLLAILKAGGAYVPLDPEYPKERIEFVLQDAQTAVLLTQERLLALAAGCKARVFCLDTDWPKVANLEQSDLSNAATPQHLAYAIYTSGSTGKPKGVQIPHCAVVSFMQSMARTPGVTPKDTLLAVTTLSFDIAGLELWLPLTVGAQAVIAKRDTARDGQALAELLDSSGATVLQATPSTWQMLLTSGWRGAPHLKILCGGEAWSKELAQQLLKKSASLWNMYGPTETTIWSAACRVESDDGVFIGKPINNTQIYILDKQLQPVPTGLPGELHIGGVGLARGYHNRPELTAEKFITDPFSTGRGARLYKTGDLARFLPDGNIEYLGRLDYQVKIRGFRVELGEIEEVLNQHPAVQTSVVIAREDSPGVKRLVAYLVSRQDAVNGAMLRDHLRDKLPAYMVPAAFVTLQEFPLTPNGKVDRKALPAPESATIELGQEQKMPQTYTEQVLCHIWREWLNLERVGTQDNFFDLGGDSLMAIRIIEQMNRTFKVHLNVPVFFQNPTIERLARVLEQEHNIRAEPQLVPLRPGNSAGSLFLLEAGLGMGLCRLVESFHGGPAASATVAPLSPKAYQAAMQSRVVDYPSLEELAAPHIALIRSRYSSPCWLIGHCVGGLLAFEVARQLQNEGKPVEMIFLLDSWARIPSPGMWTRLQRMIVDGAGETLKRRARRFWKETLSRQRGTASRPDAEPESLNLLDPQIIGKIFRYVSQNHQIQPLQSRAIVFRPRERAPDRAIHYEIDGAMGWTGAFTGGMEIVDCPGDHFTMLKAPHLQFLAQEIWQKLEQNGSPARPVNHSPVNQDQRSTPALR